MPTLTVETNLSLHQLPEDFAVSLTKFAAELMDKPQSRISVILHTDQKIWRGCSDAPVMHIEICAIGAVESREQNQKNTEKIFEFIQEKTGLPLDRIVVMFYPLQKHQVGLNGSLVL